MVRYCLYISDADAWLPVPDGWDEPVSGSLISRTNMLNTAYSTDMIGQWNMLLSKIGR